MIYINDNEVKQKVAYEVENYLKASSKEREKSYVIEVHRSSSENIEEVKKFEIQKSAELKILETHVSKKMFYDFYDIFYYLTYGNVYNVDDLPYKIDSCIFEVRVQFFENKNWNIYAVDVFFDHYYD